MGGGGSGWQIRKQNSCTAFAEEIQTKLLTAKTSSCRKKKLPTPSLLSETQWLPFLTVDAIIGNQAFCHGRCNIYSGLSHNNETNTILNSLRKNKVKAQVEFTLKVLERAMVNYYRCISYERQLIIIYTLIFRNCGGLAW